jgi:hypothetical protein
METFPREFAAMLGLDVNRRGLGDQGLLDSKPSHTFFPATDLNWY